MRDTGRDRDSPPRTSRHKHSSTSPPRTSAPRKDSSPARDSAGSMTARTPPSQSSPSKARSRSPRAAQAAPGLTSVLADSADCIELSLDEPSIDDDDFEFGQAEPCSVSKRQSEDGVLWDQRKEKGDFDDEGASARRVKSNKVSSSGGSVIGLGKMKKKRGGTDPHIPGGTTSKENKSALDTSLETLPSFLGGIKPVPMDESELAVLAEKMEPRTVMYGVLTKTLMILSDSLTFPQLEDSRGRNSEKDKEREKDSSNDTEESGDESSSTYAIRKMSAGHTREEEEKSPCSSGDMNGNGKEEEGIVKMRAVLGQLSLTQPTMPLNIVKKVAHCLF